MIFLTTTSEGILRLPTTLDQISPEMLEATLEMEDRRFFSHSGVDVRSLLRATWGVVSRQKLGGASTITMQLSRLRWNLQTRSAAGKCEQMFRAIQLERHYSKDEIAAAYCMNTSLFRPSMAIRHVLSHIITAHLSPRPFSLLSFALSRSLAPSHAHSTWSPFVFLNPVSALSPITSVLPFSPFLCPAPFIALVRFIHQKLVVAG